MEKKYTHANLMRTNLWLGDAVAANDRGFLHENNIGLVVNCTKEIATPSFYSDDGIMSIRLPLNNYNMAENLDTIRRLVDDIENKVNDALQRGVTVLIHCAQGRHRSAAVVAYHLMKRKKWNYDYTKKYMLQRRPVVFYPYDPFFTFLNDTYNYYNYYN